MEIRRGEIYYISYDNAVGGEQKTGRPWVVIGSEAQMEADSCVSVVPLTTNPHTPGIAVKLWTTYRQSWAKCNQIQTVDISRLRDKMTQITEKETELIEEGICRALGLNREKETAVMERDEEIESLRDAVLNHSVDADYYKRAYEKVLAELVEERVGRRITDAAVAVESEPEKVDVNSCGLDELLDIGFKTSVAMNIVAGRPYENVDELRAVPGMTRMAFQIAQPKIGVVAAPVKKASGKVNVNTATWQEIADATGMGKQTAQSITGYRNKHGRFQTLDELTVLPRFGTQCLKKYGDKLEV